MDQNQIQYYRKLAEQYPDKKDLIFEGASYLHSPGSSIKNLPDVDTLLRLGEEYRSKQPAEIVKGFKKANQEMQASGFGALGLVGSAVGSDKLRDYGYEGYKRNMAEAEEVAPRVNKVEEIGSFSDATDWFMGTLGSLGPSVLEAGAAALAGGGIGGLAARKAGKEAIETAVEKYVAKKVGEGVLEAEARAAAREAVAGIIKSGAMATGRKVGLVAGVAPVESGSMFGQSADEVGVENVNPYVTGLMGTISAASELAGPEGELLTNGIKKYGRGSIFKEYIKDTAKEGGQEVVQQGLGDVNRLVNNPDATLSGSDYLNAFAAGSIGGLSFGAPSAARDLMSPKAPQDIIKSAKGEAAPVETPVVDEQPIETERSPLPGMGVVKSKYIEPLPGMGIFNQEAPMASGLQVNPKAAPIESVQLMPVEEQPAVNEGLQIEPEPEPIQEPDIFNARAEATLDDGIKYTYGENKAGKPSIFAHDQTGKLLDAVTYKNHEIASSEFVKLTEPVQEALPVEQPIVPAMGLQAMPKAEAKKPAAPAKGLSLDQDEFGGMGLPVYESKGVINESEKTKEEKASIALPDKKKTEAPEGVNVTSVDGMSYNDIDNLHASQRKTVESLINDKPFKAKKKIRETLKALQENQKRAVAFVSYTNKNQSGSYNKGKNNGLQGFIESIEGRKLNEFFQKLSDGVFDVENNNAKVSIEQKSEAVPFKAPEGVKLTSTGGPFKISGAKKAVARHTKNTGEAAEVVSLGGSNYGWRIKDAILDSDNSIGIDSSDGGVSLGIHSNSSTKDVDKNTDGRQGIRRGDGEAGTKPNIAQPGSSKRNTSDDNDALKPESKPVVANETPVDDRQTDLTLKDEQQKEPWNMAPREKESLLDSLKSVKGLNIYPGGDISISQDTDLSAIVKINPKLTVAVKDTNGSRVNIPVDQFEKLTKNPAFSERIRGARLHFDGPKPTYYTDENGNLKKETTFMGVDVDNIHKLLPSSDEEVMHVEPINGVVLENNAHVRNDRMNSFQSAINNKVSREGLQKHGIKKVSIESPHKFDLGEQGNVVKKTKTIALNADASNPTRTLHHEIGHMEYDTLTSEQKNRFGVLLESVKNKAVDGYKKLSLQEEAFAETYAHQGEVWADNLLKQTKETPISKTETTGQRKTEKLDWFVNYTERENTGRTTEIKRFGTLRDAEEFSNGKYGYITRTSDGGSDYDLSKSKTKLIKYFGGFEPSAQEVLTIKNITRFEEPKEAPIEKEHQKEKPTTRTFTDIEIEGITVAVKGILPNGKVGEYKESAKTALSDIDHEISLYEKIRDCIG